MERKGRERPDRGMLKAFDDLPKERQEVFRNIKKIVNSYFKKDVEVYVGGSHFYGYWDDLSDYDVNISEKEYNYHELVSFIKNSEIQFHVGIAKTFEKNILIL
jgi:predicted nucleotidyltransferase